MVRIAALALVLVTALLLASVVLPAFAILGFRPDVLALVVLLVGLTEGPESGARVGFAAGLAGDLLAGPDQLLGIASLVLLLLGYAGGQARSYLTATTPVGQATCGAVAGALSAAGSGLLVLMLDPQRLEVLTLLLSVLVVGLYTAAVAPLVSRPLLAVLRRIRPAAVADIGSLGGR
jgi:rod shape-determining protein MreD